jgi:hypothetical protein
MGFTSPACPAIQIIRQVSTKKLPGFFLDEETKATNSFLKPSLGTIAS